MHKILTEIPQHLGHPVPVSDYRPAEVNHSEELKRDRRLADVHLPQEIIKRLHLWQDHHPGTLHQAEEIIHTADHQGTLLQSQEHVLAWRELLNRAHAAQDFQDQVGAVPQRPDRDRLG